VPYLHTLAHHTYITDITTCFPSFPNHVVTTSMDGYSRLASLLTSSDELPNNRSRLAPLATAWVDAIQSAVSVEEATWVKFYPFRRFFSSTIAAKHAGTVRSLSTSFFHPHLLSGGTDGEALISNPSRRVFHGKIKTFQQTWFMWEWSEQTGLLRMVEGFKLEECEGKAKMKGEKQLLTSIYPKEVGVTATAWNGNEAFAGWASAAGAKGLVRVEDVAID
jgi:transcription factor C subunit 6